MLAPHWFIPKDGKPHQPTARGVRAGRKEGRHSHAMSAAFVGTHSAVDRTSIACRAAGTIPFLCCSSSTKDVAEQPKMTKIAIVYYSMYGHVRALALEVKKGLESAGCNVTLLRVAETLPDEVLKKMGAPGIGKEDEEATAVKLAEYDGFMFGLSARFGMMPAQMKALLDSTGGLWQSGALLGKPAGIFFSTGTQNGGQETAAFTFLTQLVHHGMIFVPMGYSNPLLFDLKEPHGGSPYGAGTLAGPDGSRTPSDLEKKVAVHHGEHFASAAKKLTA